MALSPRGPQLVSFDFLLQLTMDCGYIRVTESDDCPVSF
jgi:hypothetical protein